MMKELKKYNKKIVNMTSKEHFVTASYICFSKYNYDDDIDVEVNNFEIAIRSDYIFRKITTNIFKCIKNRMGNREFIVNYDFNKIILKCVLTKL